MDPLLKDWIQAASWGVAIIGGLIAAFIGIFQLRASTQQRNSELRWKKASLARDILNEMWNDPYCSDAILMLEWERRWYKIKDGNEGPPNNKNSAMISKGEVFSALEDPGGPLDNKGRYIRDCFVRFFKMTEVIAHYVSIGLIDIDDLRYPYRFYANKIRENYETYEIFLTAYNFRNAKRLFKQIEQMKSLSQLFSTTEISKALKIQERELINLMSDGRIKAEKKAGRWYSSKKSLEEYFVKANSETIKTIKAYDWDWTPDRSISSLTQTVDRSERGVSDVGKENKESSSCLPDQPISSPTQISDRSEREVSDTGEKNKRDNIC